MNRPSQNQEHSPEENSETPKRLIDSVAYHARKLINIYKDKHIDGITYRESPTHTSLEISSAMHGYWFLDVSETETEIRVHLMKGNKKKWRGTTWGQTITYNKTTPNLLKIQTTAMEHPSEINEIMGKNATTIALPEVYDFSNEAEKKTAMQSYLSGYYQEIGTFYDVLVKKSSVVKSTKD